MVDVRGSVNDSVAIISASQKVKGYTFFMELRKQKNVVIPEGVQVFGGQWFIDSTIENVIIPVSVTEISREAFYNCKSLKSIIFAPGSKLEQIRTGAFRNTRIESVTIPSSVVEIQESAFDGCESLKEVMFEERSKLEKIGSACFRDTEIEKIVIPKGVEEIQDSAFRDCKNLREVVFEAGSVLKKIGNHALFGCNTWEEAVFSESAIETVTLSSTLKRLE